MKKLILSLFLITSAIQAQQTLPPPAPGGFRGSYAGPYQTSGITNYYWIQTRAVNGRSSISGPVTLLNQPASYIQGQQVAILSWGPVPTATYDILKTTTSTSPTGACNCAIDVNESATGFTDMGQPLLTYTVQGASAVFPFSATPIFDASTSTYFEMLLTANVTSSTLINTFPGQTIAFHICENGTGGFTFAWPSTLGATTAVTTTASNCLTQEFKVNAANNKGYAIAAGTNVVF